jgi:hypothetical protein
LKIKGLPVLLAALFYRGHAVRKNPYQALDLCKSRA